MRRFLARQGFIAGTHEALYLKPGSCPGIIRMGAKEKNFADRISGRRMFELYKYLGRKKQCKNYL